MSRQSRADICPCGSGLQYGSCCLEKDKKDRSLQIKGARSKDLGTPTYLEPFERHFPELAQHETRAFWALGRKPEIDPPFVLVEFYCTDTRCDCRRVMIGVHDLAKPGKFIVSIGFAFDRGLPDAGPYIDTLNPVTAQGRKIFPIVEELLLCDSDYARQLYRHYRMVKDQLSGAYRPQKYLH